MFLQETDCYRELKAICGEDTFLSDVSMKEHTSMRVGGKADVMIQPDSFERLQNCIAFLHSHQMPFMVIGNGSNLIFPDEGYRGVIVKIGPRLSKIEVKDTLIVAQSGALLSSVANRALEHALTGLEFASGIPGSIGGAAFMNAGAYDGEMKQVITETLCLDRQGRFITLKGDDHHFSYRHSRMQEEDLTCLHVVLQLQYGDQKAIQEKMNDLNGRRRDKQPLHSQCGKRF